MKLPRLRLLLALLLPSMCLLPAIAVDDSTAVYPPGKFAWVDLVTTDPDAAIAFYTKMFGWTTREVRGGRERYTFLLNHGRPVAGVAYRGADQGSKATAGARWVGSISVSDIQAAAKAVVAAGGRVLVAPRQIEGRGWQALVTDPENCLLGLITREAGGSAENEAEENNWVWAQLISRNPATAVAFYRKALGYQIDEDIRSKRADDFVLSMNGEAYAGLTPMPEGTDGRPGWVGYLRVADTEATVKQATALGARVLYRQDEPDRLQVAILADPLGGAIGIVSMPAAPEETK
jgi:uncharacterized protein